MRAGLFCARPSLSDTHPLILLGEKAPQMLSETLWSAKIMSRPVTRQGQIHKAPAPSFSKPAIDLTLQPQTGHGCHVQPRSLLLDMVIDKNLDAPGNQASCLRLFVQAGALRPHLFEAPVRVQHGPVVILGQPPVSPVEDEADCLADGVNGNELIKTNIPGGVPACIGIIQSSDLELDASFPVRDGGVEMGDEFVQDGVPDAAFQIAEQGFANRGIMGLRNLKA